MYEQHVPTGSRKSALFKCLLSYCKYLLPDSAVPTCRVINKLNYYSTIVPFTILGQKNAQNIPRYYTVEQGKNTD